MGPRPPLDGYSCAVDPSVMQAAMQAHIAEHVGYAYRNKIELALGVALPGAEDELPPEMEKEISRLMAEAAPQVLAQSQAMVAQQQAQQNAQDPVLQMQMQELQIKGREVDIKERKLIADATAKADELKLKEAEIMSKEKIAGLNAQIQVSQDDKNRLAKEKEFAVSTGVDMAHKRALLNKETKNTKE